MHKYGFSFVQRRYYYKERVLSAEEYLLLLGTYSDILTMEPGRKEAFLREIEGRFWTAAVLSTSGILWICTLGKTCNRTKERESFWLSRSFVGKWFV